MSFCNSCGNSLSTPVKASHPQHTTQGAPPIAYANVYQPSSHGYDNQQAYAQAPPAVATYAQAPPAVATYVQPPTVVTGQMVTPDGRCAHATTGTSFSILGILLAVFCFPLGILCCLLLTDQTCVHCGARMA